MFRDNYYTRFIITREWRNSYYFYSWLKYSGVFVRLARKFSMFSIGQFFSDLSLNSECIEYCDEKQESCRSQCSRNTTCIFQCNYEAVDCLSSCPCFKDCPNGCDDCLTPFCKCHDYETSLNYLECSDFYEGLYHECMFNCPANDWHCIAACSRELDENLKNCPCRSLCPNGCPCPNYECPEVTTTAASTETTPAKRKNSVLVLSTYDGYKHPVITDANGRENYNFYFRFGENTSIYYSCSMIYKNDLFVFGGHPNNGDERRQISKLVGCKLKRIGTLDFDHYNAPCTNFNDEKVYLCFNNHPSDYKRCRYANNPDGLYLEATSSIHDHRFSSVAASHCECVLFTS